MTDQLVQVPPEKILADDNSRFSLKRSRVDSLAASILESGGVLTPVEVEPLKPAQNGFEYRLTSGFYRHAAVAKLNKEQQAGLLIPAMVRKPADATDRLKHQLAENMERENQSPMDQAIAIKKLMDAGMPRLEIRRIFARPGGKKGAQIQPASNAWVNIVLRFLELPKAIQTKIHEGVIGVEAAYELGKVPPEKRQAVVERAEAERLRQLEIEEKDEEKYLQAENRLIEAQSKEKEAVSQVDATKAAIEAAEKTVAEKLAALKAIQKEPYLELDAKGKEELKERLKAAETDLKGAEKASKDAKNELAKLLNTAKKAAEVAEEQKAKLDAARKAVKSNGKKAVKPVGKEDVRAAAKAEGVDTGSVPLNATEVKQYVKDMTRIKEWPKVAAIGHALQNCFSGVTTPKQLYIELAEITGESKPAARPAGAAKLIGAGATAAAKSASKQPTA